MADKTGIEWTDATRYHSHIPVGALQEQMHRRRGSGDSGLERSDGTPLSVDEASDYLRECVRDGKHVLPLCRAEHCPHFDYSGKGCPGHQSGGAQ